MASTCDDNLVSNLALNLSSNTKNNNNLLSFINEEKFANNTIDEEQNLK